MFAIFFTDSLCKKLTIKFLHLEHMATPADAHVGCAGV